MPQTLLLAQLLKPDMKLKELRVVTTAATDDLTPTSGKRIRLLGFSTATTVLSNLTSTVRSTLAFGTGHISDTSKIIMSCRPINTYVVLCDNISSLSILGAVDEVIRLTNITFSAGSVITRAVLRYVEE